MATDVQVSPRQSHLIAISAPGSLRASAGFR